MLFHNYRTAAQFLSAMGYINSGFTTWTRLHDRARIVAANQDGMCAVLIY